MNTTQQIQRFAARIDENLRRSERANRMRVVTSRHLNVILSDCGMKRRGHNNVKLIERARAEQQVYTSPAMSDPGLKFDQMVHFSRTQPVPARFPKRRLIFPAEQALSEFLVANFDFLFPALKLVKPEYELTSGDRVDILASDRKSHDFVAIELKVVNRDRSTPSQIVSYMEEIRAKQQESSKPRGVRGMVIASDVNEVLLRHVEVLASATGFTVDWYVCRIEMTLDAQRAS